MVGLVACFQALETDIFSRALEHRATGHSAFPRFRAFSASFPALRLFTRYRIFSIKRPQRLFQTWNGVPGVPLNKQLIWARHCFKKGLLQLYS